jgi:hypothetical protein
MLLTTSDESTYLKILLRLEERHALFALRSIDEWWHIVT